MELLNLIFRLGVVFAIFGFLFGLFELALTVLQGGRMKGLWESYLIKLIKYLVLVSVTFLFCMNLDEGKISNYHLIVATLVLLTYFVGKLQSKQEQQMMFNNFGKNLNMGNLGAMGNFNLKAEILVILISVGLFFVFLMYPAAASNKISLWFHDSILNIEDTPVFGFIFKVIGFFFVVNILMKFLNGLAFLTTGRAFMKVRSGVNARKDNDDHFDDFEEIN